MNPGAGARRGVNARKMNLDERSFNAAAPAECQEVPGGAGRRPTAVLNGCVGFKEGSGKYRGTTYVKQYA